MSKKRLRAVIAAVLLALTLSFITTPLAAPTAVLATECDATACGGG